MINLKTLLHFVSVVSVSASNLRGSGRSYEAGITSAVAKLKEPKGSSSISIRKEMQAIASDEKTRHDAPFVRFPKNAADDGVIVQMNEPHKSSNDFKRNVEEANVVSYKTNPKPEAFRDLRADDLEKNDLLGANPKVATKKKKNNLHRNILQQDEVITTNVEAPAAGDNAYAYAVPNLNYPFEALEPFIDAPTMKSHHRWEHGAYVANLNKAMEGKEKLDILELQMNAIEAGPAVRNNGGGHYNHAFFWDEMSPPDEAEKTKPSADLKEAIDKAFGSFDAMKAAFEFRAVPGALFGSGWVWICFSLMSDGLKLVETPNEDNPLMRGVLDEVMFPILGIDVWEHAYYLKYHQNRRPEYVSNWWNVVNWNKVSENFDYVTKNGRGVPVRGME